MACENRLYPDYDASLPSTTEPIDVVVLSIPTLATALLWIVFESRKCRVRFTTNMKILARLVIVAGSVAQGFLIWRMFEIFECENLFGSSKSWVAVPLATLTIVHLILVFSLFHRVPRLCALTSLSVAAACVAGEYAGRDVIQTSAVQLLVPLQQLYCTFVVCFLTAQKKGRVVADAGRRPTKTLKSIDPLQRRRETGGGEEEERKWSWWA